LRDLFIQSCLRDKGFVVELIEHDDDALVITGDWETQQEAFYEALFACEAEAVDAGLALPRREPTEEELSELYHLYRWTYDCLLENGYPAEQPPSEAEWVESGGRSWHPYSALPYTHMVFAPNTDPPQSIIEEARRIEEMCPDQPDEIRARMTDG
jgi:hypothetical protein